MRNLALKIPAREESRAPTEPRVLEAVVARRQGTAFVLRAEGAEVSARRAVSCLVDPEPADRVLVTELPDGQRFVLAVLDRQEGAPAILSHDGDLEVHLAAGRLQVVAQHGVGITSAEDVSVVSARVDVRAVDAALALARVTMAGKLVQAEIEKVKLFGQTVDSFFERASQHVKRSYRVVEELDQVRAGAVDYVARAILRLHGKNAVVTSEEVVKVDANQIHMG